MSNEKQPAPENGSIETYDARSPVVLSGSDISYFTGKMENYFRVREIPYELRNMQFPRDDRVRKREVGVTQMPTVELPDGRWMTDTTKMIQWFEAQFPENGLLPADPLQAFLCFLLEDWADEWWWRPAMHYRWYSDEGSRFAAWHLAETCLSEMSAPIALKWRYLRRRQRSGYTAGDGIGEASVAAVEADYHRLLASLETIFRDRPFLLGQRPTLADIGFAGPFFRHFALDPVPLEILRRQAPSVLEWVARLWKTRIAECRGTLLDGIPEDFGSLLDEIGHTYLPYLNANIAAVRAGQKRFDVNLGGAQFRGARYSRYRVWCLAELRLHYERMPASAQAAGRALLERHGCWAPLWQENDLPLLPDQEQGLPFRGDTKMVGFAE